jgi:hypothetical protein
MIDTAIPEELVVAELQRHCREIIEAELARLRRAVPTLSESIMVEVDRSLGQVVDGWLLAPVRRHPDRGREISALFGLTTPADRRHENEAAA